LVGIVRLAARRLVRHDYRVKGCGFGWRITDEPGAKLAGRLDIRARQGGQGRTRRGLEGRAPPSQGRRWRWI
jgi:hypothetical protein